MSSTIKVMICSTSEDMQYNSGTSSVQASEDVQYKQKDHKVLVQGGGGTTLKYFPMNESLFFLIFSVKIVSSLWEDAKINSL